MKRRLLALALALCIALSLAPAALAADTDTADQPLYHKAAAASIEPTNDPIDELEPAISIFCQFFTDAVGTQEVLNNLTFEPDTGTAQEAVELQMETENYDDGTSITAWWVAATAFGSGRIVYTDKNGTRYSVRVISSLPKQGFSSTPELTQETYLISGQSSFVVNEPFYYIFPEGTKIRSVKVDQCSISGDALSMEVLADKPNVCKLTVTAAAATSRTHSFRVAFTIPRENSPTSEKVYKERITLRDGTPRPGFRYAHWTNGELDSYGDYFSTSLDLELGDTFLGGFFCGNTQNNTLLDITSAAFCTNDGEPSDAFTAEKRDDGCWRLTANALAEGVLLCTAADGKTYALPVSITLPRLGFYTDQTRSADTCITDFFYYNAKTGKNTFWLISKKGFTVDEADAAIITCEYNVNTEWFEPAASDYFTWEAVARADDPKRYDLQFTVKPGVTLPAKELNLCVSGPLGSAFLTLTTDVNKSDSSALTVTIDGTDYVVGFGFAQNGSLTINTDGRWAQSYMLPTETDDDASIHYYCGQPEKSWGILAATGTPTSYVPAPEIQQQITVNRVWLERSSGSSGEDGNTNTFSFSQTERRLSLTENLTTDGIPIYVADEVGEAYLCAEISVGSTSGTIYTRLYYRRQKVVNETFNTVEALNNWLINNKDAIHAAALDDETDTTWNLNLPYDSYSGTITIPKTLGDTNGRSLGIAILGNNTSLHGSINLNGAVIDTISHLNFTPQSETDTAIQNGSAVVDGCTFNGYKTALSGALFPHNCTFRNNTTALVLDLASARLRSEMYNCLFEGNDTAVQVKSIALDSEFLSPYHLRLHDSAFLNNTTDFDVQTAGTFYFLRNFFAHHDSGSLPSIRPTVKVSNGAAVYVNPVWKYRSDSGVLSELTLVEDMDTRLPVDADWSNASIDADSLTADTQIDLADENDKTVATWSKFQTPTAQQSHPALYSADEMGTDTASDGFRPGVSIDTQPTGELTVTVADSAALTEKTPLLTIPCDLESAVVTLDGDPIESKLEKGNLSFRVADGGTYTVRPGTSVKYEDGTFTIENAPEKAVTAIAALYDQNGRFLTAATAQIANGAATIPLQKPDSATYRVYYLTKNNTPV